MLITVIFLSIRTNDILKNVASFFIGFMWHAMPRIKIQNLYKSKIAGNRLFSFCISILVYEYVSLYVGEVLLWKSIKVFLYNTIC